VAASGGRPRRPVFDQCLTGAYSAFDRRFPPHLPRWPVLLAGGASSQPAAARDRNPSGGRRCGQSGPAAPPLARTAPPLTKAAAMTTQRHRPLRGKDQGLGGEAGAQEREKRGGGPRLHQPETRCWGCLTGGRKLTSCL
jgi:hypothetical protein